MSDTTLSPEKYETPTGRIPAVLQFNAITGQFIAALTGDKETFGGQDLFAYEDAQWDFSNDVVLGNYPDYKVVDRKEVPAPIYESALDAIARDKITKAYPVIQQVNVLSRAIMALSEKLGVDQDELVEMVAYINEVKLANENNKQGFRENPAYEYISIADAEAAEAARLEGGVHEAYGPRPSAGGSVW
jgi:hypothetical protein